MDSGRYFTITERGESEPWALVRVAGGLYERWVPGTGWVGTPFFLTYFAGGEPGAGEVRPDEAVRLQATGIGAEGVAGAELLRGKP